MIQSGTYGAFTCNIAGNFTAFRMIVRETGEEGKAFKVEIIEEEPVSKQFEIEVFPREGNQIEIYDRNIEEIFQKEEDIERLILLLGTGILKLGACPKFSNGIPKNNTRCMLQDLKKSKELNQKEGLVIGFSGITERLHIELTCGRIVKAKLENVKILG